MSTAAVTEGAHWENLGLEDSQHITKIIVHPEDSDVVWVAARDRSGSKGGDRGLYKTADGGPDLGKGRSAAASGPGASAGDP